VDESEFVSIASHELRTPISVVHGIAATLHARRSDLDEQQVDALIRTLVQQTGRLCDLADQLLDFSRLESEGESGRAERFHPRESLEELLPRIAADRLDDVWLTVDPDYELVADAVAFERVAANLIVNALRYGEAPVEVRGEKGERFRLVVEDHGEGVPPEFVPHLFEPFSRSDESRREGSPGAGLGLSIASAYATALDGRLEYEDAQPHGARFTLSLPAARS
jgi:two-component system, OmpR family, phosphate regulon sensor histidine kinase PhoR